MYKNDKIRMKREILKQMFFNSPFTPELTQTITINGSTVTIESDGPSGFHHFATYQDNPIEYAMKKMEKDEYKNYKLIIK